MNEEVASDWKNREVTERPEVWASTLQGHMALCEYSASGFYYVSPLSGAALGAPNAPSTPPSLRSPMLMGI
ncbi:hypothetical protein NECAME_15923 [Necator americanus]|uniref:Uncharacterized protein n=1 Tax=Necator americanus TaxID=51031 RepID=W2SF84_NECAM|nr:hypothetical protein NECAME_15923 [Necator americanus]ETN68254.1 hypothetical protein NECAME_15923 [Necator americanus]